MDKRDLAKIAYQHQNTYIKLADQKASILISGQIAFVVLVLNLISNTTVELSIQTVVMITISILFSLMSILFSILTVLPREESGISEGFVYWNDIKKYDDQDAYAEAIADLDGDTPLNEISHDIYNLSSVAQEKYNHLRCSIIFSIGFLLFGSISAISFVIYS